MNNDQLTFREWQTLSAYLDNQLNSRERRGLETRLQTEGGLRQGLEEMRRTRTLLRSAPRRRAPHNFTITRAQADAYRPAAFQPWRAFPALRLASALASILLVAAFVGDFATGAMLRAAAPAVMDQAAPAQAPLMESARQAETSPSEGEMNTLMLPAEPLPQTTATPGLLMGAAPAEPTLDATQQIIQAMTAAPPGMGMGMGSAGAEITPSEESRSMLAGPSMTPGPAPESFMKAAGEAAPYPAPEERAALDAAAYPPPDAAVESGETLEAPAFDLRGLFRPLEIALAMIALITGAGALLLRRR